MTFKSYKTHSHQTDMLKTMRIQFIKPANKKLGRLISFTEIEKSGIHSKGNVVFLTGQWNFDQSEVQVKCYQIFQDISVLCSKCHFTAL